MKLTNRIAALSLALGLSVGLGACGLSGNDDVAPPITPTTVATTSTTEATTTTSTTEATTTTSTTEAEVGVAGDAVDRDALPNTGASEAAVLAAAALALVLAGRTMFDIKGWLTRPKRRVAPYAYRARYSEIVE